MRMNATAASVLFDPPDAGFDAPFEMLAACHERVEHSLRLLERLAQHLTVHGADTQARDAARDVLRYFDVAAPQHHQDEERHVLPALRALGQGALADRLLNEHAQMAGAWAEARVHLLAVQAGDTSISRSDDADHRRAWRELARLYREHAALEDAIAFPAAAAALDAVQQQAMGDEMARRRGVR
jgi:iron-sulfur cluster repair protein YtfE (RIC family)